MTLILLDELIYKFYGKWFDPSPNQAGPITSLYSFKSQKISIKLDELFYVDLPNK